MLGPINQSGRITQALHCEGPGVAQEGSTSVPTCPRGAAWGKGGGAWECKPGAGACTQARTREGGGGSRARPCELGAVAEEGVHAHAHTRAAGGGMPREVAEGVHACAHARAVARAQGSASQQGRWMGACARARARAAAGGEMWGAAMLAGSRGRGVGWWGTAVRAARVCVYTRAGEGSSEGGFTAVRTREVPDGACARALDAEMA
ncbi:hypothetical protein BC827DRAFT_1382622 [Russula dissimulans]|nr:hypothetical protein BC827DRAFT_1382622 [Russula dissimulans]